MAYKESSGSRLIDSSQMGIGTEIRVLPVFPLSDGEVTFEEMDCVSSGREINIIEDSELGKTSVLELGNNSSLTFFTHGDASLPFLVFQLRNVDKFFTITLIVSDTTGCERIVEMSNKRSTICIDNNLCQLPVEIGAGWQYLCIDLNDLLQRAFGTKYRSCSEITVKGSNRVSKIFFEEKQYADVQLPSFLRIVQSDS